MEQLTTLSIKGYFIEFLVSNIILTSLSTESTGLSDDEICYAHYTLGEKFFCC